MRFLDLFAGIGGFRLGMEMAGHTPVGYVEWDKFARKSYEAMHNTEGEWTAHDITTVTDDDIRQLRDRGQIDVICGGFPCQAFSVAGKRKGFDDTRGTLFFDIMRFANIIRPRYLFLENVRGLLNHDNGNTFETILRTLDDIGYDAEWQVLNSKDYGVPQNRERVFIIGHLRETSGRKVFPVEPISREVTGRKKVLGADYRYDEGLRIRDNGISPCLMANNSKMMDDGLSGKPYAVLTPDRLNERQNGRRFKEDGEPMFTLTSQDRHGVMVVGNTSKTNHGGMNVYDARGISPTLKARDYKGPVQIKIKEATKKGYAEAEPGDSVNYSVPTSKTRRGRVGKNIANTLDTGVQQGVVTEDIRIRKLTPRECFRLQGFPDELFNKATEVNSDSQLYKQAGNSVTVNVIYEIAKRLGD